MSTNRENPKFKDSNKINRNQQTGSIKMIVFIEEE